MLGLMALLFPHILGVGYPAIDLSLMQKLSWQVLFLLIVFKVLATSITIGSGGSGGIFAPSLFLGAMAGGFFGTVVHGIFPSITAPPGAYGIVGMGAVVSGTTHGRNAFLSASLCWMSNPLSLQYREHRSHQQ